MVVRHCGSGQCVAMEARWSVAQQRLHAAVKDGSGSWKEIFARRREAQLAALPRKGFHGGGPSSAGLSLCGGRDGLLRAKAFASNLAGDDGGGAFGRRSPCWGCHLGAPFLLQGSLGENPVQFGRAMAAPPTSSPPWRRRFLRPISRSALLVTTVHGWLLSVVEQVGFVQGGELLGVVKLTWG